MKVLFIMVPKNLDLLSLLNMSFEKRKMLRMLNFMSNIIIIFIFINNELMKCQPLHMKGPST